jgi:hypothetical protein
LIEPAEPVSEPQTEAGRTLDTSHVAYLAAAGSDGHFRREAWLHDILAIEREAVLRWLDTEAEGLLASVEKRHRKDAMRYIEAYHCVRCRTAWPCPEMALVSHLRERMTP